MPLLQLQKNQARRKTSLKKLSFMARFVNTLKIRTKPCTGSLGVKSHETFVSNIPLSCRHGAALHRFKGKSVNAQGLGGIAPVFARAVASHRARRRDDK